MISNNQVTSRERVSDHGEVYTGESEIKAMVYLVDHEAERTDSRILEPACGSGNFLAEILNRKLYRVGERYVKSQIEFERYSILALTSIYGIDILEDNVDLCRKRLLSIFRQHYEEHFSSPSEEVTASTQWIVSKNIIHGDALSLRRVGTDAPIVFTEWSMFADGRVKRREFTFHGLLEHESVRELPLFSDLGEDVFIPTPVREYPIVHYLRVVDDD